MRARTSASCRELLVHQQVEVALAVALLDVGEAVERVGQRRADAREQLERVDLERRLAAARLRGRAGDADDVAEVDVDLARALDRAEQLDAPGAVDEVEEDELPHVAARHDAAGEPALRRRRSRRSRAAPPRRGRRRSRRGRESASARPWCASVGRLSPRSPSRRGSPTPSAAAKSSQPVTSERGVGRCDGRRARQRRPRQSRRCMTPRGDAAEHAGSPRRRSLSASGAEPATDPHRDAFVPRARARAAGARCRCTS